MTKRLLPLALAIVLLPCLAEAQASVQLRLDLPVVLPPTVVVTPGVRVVPDLEQEVFFVDGFYWVRHDGGWYRARNHRGGWAYVAPRGVPGSLVRLPPGQYKRWHPTPGRGYARPAPAPSPFHASRAAPAPVRYERYDHDRGEGHGKKYKPEKPEKFEKHEKHGRD